MKFSIARADLQSLLNAILPTRALFKADTLEISACAARVFVTWKGTVAGIESLVLEDGAVSLAAKAFREVIETYKGTHVLFFEGGPDGLRIQNLHMRVLGYDPSPKPPGEFQVFRACAPPGAATHDTPREAEEETEQATESAQEAPEELWLVNLNYDPLFIESIGKTALRAAVEILQESIADGKQAHDAIADAIIYLKTNVPAINEDKARAFFDQFLQDLADLQLENDSEGQESPTAAPKAATRLEPHEQAFFDEMDALLGEDEPDQQPLSASEQALKLAEEKAAAEQGHAEAAQSAEQLGPKTETLKTEPPQPATEAVPLEAGSAHPSRRCAMNDKFAIRGLYISWALGLVMLGLAVSGKHPHNFYTLLRWIVCAVFAFSAFAALWLKRPLWACVFAVQAVLFNPFAEFHFRRDTWQTLDKFSIASVVLAALVEVLFRKTKLISKWREAFSPLTAVAAVAAIGSGIFACYLYAVHPSTLQPEAIASESAPSPPVQHEPIPNLAVAAKTSAPNKQPQAPTESAEAEYQTGLKFLTDKAGKMDDKKAFEHFKNAAEAGHALAQARLAICYALGIGVEINKTEGNRLAQESWQAVESAAQNNNADAQRCLGRLNEEGIGIAKNYAEAMKWYRKAANLGDVWAMSNIGMMYASGEGVAKDYAEALNWYRKAADLGNVDAMSNIGTMYENGDGVAKDYAEALKWFHRAADLGDADATKEIGAISGYGEGGAKNYTEAMRWFQRAADLGNTEAMTNIGMMYENGDGVAKDYAEALKWFHRAADLGDADAMNGIGTMYWNGEGVAKDYAETMKWYRKAADSGSAEAMSNIGLIYKNGNGVTKDYAEAMNWYRKAADSGSAEAMSNIGLIYKNGNGVTKDYAEAMNWYRKAADLGNVDAMSDIGAMYENGEGVAKDYAEAIKWYRKAADLGDADAENSVKRLGSSLKMTATFHKVATSWYSWASVATLITVILVWRIARHRNESDW